MKKKHVFLLTLPVACLLLGSCHKTCACKGYDGLVHNYTASEVKERGVSCSDMIYQAGITYYSLCEWE